MSAVLSISQDYSRLAVVKTEVYSEITHGYQVNDKTVNPLQNITRQGLVITLNKGIQQ